MRSVARWFAAALAAAALLSHPTSAAPLVDSAGRTVDVPERPAHVLPAGPPADVLLVALAPQLALGLVENFSKAQMSMFPEAARGLPRVPRLTGHPTDNELDILKALKPDLIVDYGDVNQTYAGLADEFQGKLGAPYLLFDGGLRKSPEVFRTLGATLGAAERGEMLARAIEAALDALKFVSALPDAERVAVYCGRGPDGLQAIRAGTSLSEGLTLAGLKNVVPAGQGAFVEMSAEDIAKLAPSVVIVTDPAAAAPGGKLRSALPAGTRFLVDAGQPFHWAAEPPSINRLIGALALAEALYPDKAKGAAAEASELNTLMFPGAPATARLAP